MTDRVLSASSMKASDVRYDTIRVVACLAVILLHVSAKGMYMFMAGEVSHKWWLIAAGINSATRWCVPVFIMLSGALLLQRPHSWRETYLRRLPRMALVLATATIIYALWQIYFTREFTAQSFLTSLYNGQPYYHLYFLFVIMGLYALLPVMSRLFSQIDEPTAFRTTAIACVVTSVTFTLSGISATALTFATPYISYFALGYCLSHYQPRLPYRRIALGAYVVTFAAVEIATLVKGANWSQTLYPHTYFAPNIYIFAIGIFGALFEVKPRPKLAALFGFLSPLTLIAYIIHPMIMETLRWIFGVHFPALANLRFDLPVVYILTVCLAFGAAFVLRKIPVIKRYF